MKADNDPEKWEMKGQTEVKHEILGKYLEPWLNKITETSPVVQYIDGFAGKGRYNDGSEGSPLIAINVATERLETLSGKLKEFRCTFIEENRDNFDDLKIEVNERITEGPSEIKTDIQNREFEDFAREFIEKDGGQFPAFIFVDPFGFSGVPFEIVEELINLRSSGIEVFITFMSGKMAQYMETSSHQVAITNILGTNEWKTRIDPELSKDDRAEELLKMYGERLRNVAGVDYVWPFQMKEESKRQTSYYLIHSTNHFDGFKIMKDIMFNAGAKHRFAYLGPDHYPYLRNQQSLQDFTSDDEVDERVQDLAVFLREQYAGKPSRTLWKIMEETYDETQLIEKHYRKAGKIMRDRGLAEITNHPNRRYGREDGSGFGKHDEIKFFAGGLSNYTNQSAE